MTTTSVTRSFTNLVSLLVFRGVYRAVGYLSRWWEKHQIAEIRRMGNLRLGANVFIYGIPYIRIHNDAAIIVGKNVTLNSAQRNCLVSAYGPVTLIAEHAGAEIRIGDQTRIHASCIRAYSLVSIGSRCLIASNCQIMDASGHALSFPNVERRISDVILDSEPILVEDDVWLCEGVKILPGVTIGKGTVVGAGSVVTKNLPSYCLAGGIPAKVIMRQIPCTLQ